MKICVCIKEVPDSDTPPDKLSIDKEKLKIFPTENISSTVNTFDLNAVELALKFSENFKDCEITIISVGNNFTIEVIKKPIAMGADKLVICESEKLDNIDVYTTANILSKMINKTGPYDVIFCGRHASDFDMASVPFAISEILTIPIINIVKDIKPKKDEFIIEKIITDGFQVLSAKLPLILTVGNQAGDPRFPTLKGIMEASKTKLEKIHLSDLNLNSNDDLTNQIEIEKIYFPENDNQIKFISGENNKEKAVNLLKILKKEGIF